MDEFKKLGKEKSYEKEDQYTSDSVPDNHLIESLGCLCQRTFYFAIINDH